MNLLRLNTLKLKVRRHKIAWESNLSPRLQSGNGKIIKRDLGGNPDPVLAHHLEEGWKRKIECSPTRSYEK